MGILRKQVLVFCFLLFCIQNSRAEVKAPNLVIRYGQKAAVTIQDGEIRALELAGKRLGFALTANRPKKENLHYSSPYQLLLLGLEADRIFPLSLYSEYPFLDTAPMFEARIHLKFPEYVQFQRATPYRHLLAVIATYRTYSGLFLVNTLSIPDDSGDKEYEFALDKPLHVLANEADQFSFTEFSPDGNFLTATAQSNDKQVGVLHTWDLRAIEQKTNEPSITLPPFQNELHRSIPLYKISKPEYVTYSPSGSKIMIAGQHRILVLDAHNYRRLGYRAVLPQERFVTWPQFSDDEKRIVMLSSIDRGADNVTPYYLRNWVFDPPYENPMDRKVLHFDCDPQDQERPHSVTFEDPNNLLLSTGSGRVFRLSAELTRGQPGPCRQPPLREEENESSVEAEPSIEGYRYGSITVAP